MKIPALASALSVIMPAALLSVAIAAPSLGSGPQLKAGQKKPTAPSKAPVKPAQKAPADVVSIKVFISDGKDLVEAKDGIAITKETTFRVRVQAKDPISSVEFSAGGDLRDSDGSTPYEFHLDPLAEEDGELVLTFKGYTTKGTNATKTLKVKIENGVSGGIEPQLTKGNAALTEGKYDEAIQAGRIALRIDAKSVPANILLARAYLGKGVYDQSQKYAEDAVEIDANSALALETLAQANVRRAFNIFNTGSTAQSDTMANQKNAFGAAIDARVKADNLRVDAAAADKNSLAYADAALAADRYSVVIEALAPQFQGDLKDTGVANRLVYAYLMTGRIDEANETLNLVKKLGAPDAYTYALIGLIAGEKGDDKGADDAFASGLLENPDSLGVKTAQASYALKRNKVSALTGLANSLQKDSDSRPEAFFFVSAVADRLSNYDVARRAFESGVRLDPANSDLYFQNANQSLGLALTGRLEGKSKDSAIDTAAMYYDLALRARPTSAPALAGLSLIGIVKNRADDAVRYAEAAVRANPNYGAGHYALAGALSVRSKQLNSQIANPNTQNKADLQRQQREALDQLQAQLREGIRVDKAGLEGRVAPGADEVYRYLIGAGRPALISPPARG